MFQLKLHTILLVVLFVLTYLLIFLIVQCKVWQRQAEDRHHFEVCRKPNCTLTAKQCKKDTIQEYIRVTSQLLKDCQAEQVRKNLEDRKNTSESSLQTRKSSECKHALTRNFEQNWLIQLYSENHSILRNFPEKWSSQKQEKTET